MITAQMHEHSEALQAHRDELEQALREALDASKGASSQAQSVMFELNEEVEQVRPTELLSAAYRMICQLMHSQLALQDWLRVLAGTTTHSRYNAANKRAAASSQCASVAYNSRHHRHGVMNHLRGITMGERASKVTLHGVQTPQCVGGNACAPLRQQRGGPHHRAGRNVARAGARACQGRQGAGRQTAGTTRTPAFRCRCLRLACPQRHHASLARRMHVQYLANASRHATENFQVWLGKIGDLLDHKADTKALAALEARLRDEAHERLDELARPLEQQVEEASAQLHRGVQEAADAQTEVRRRVDALEAAVHDKSQARRVLHAPTRPVRAPASRRQ